MRLHTANNHHKRRQRRTVRYFRDAPGWLMEVVTIQRPGPMRRIKFEGKTYLMGNPTEEMCRLVRG